MSSADTAHVLFGTGDPGDDMYDQWTYDEALIHSTAHFQQDSLQDINDSTRYIIPSVVPSSSLQAEEFLCPQVGAKECFIQVPTRTLREHQDMMSKRPLTALQQHLRNVITISVPEAPFAGFLIYSLTLYVY